jgi:nucleotide-binding universal stress UspA family protein
VRVVVYANSVDKARSLAPWLDVLGQAVRLEAIVPVEQGAPRAAGEAADLLMAALARIPGAASRRVAASAEAPEDAIASCAAGESAELVITAPAGRRGLTRLIHGSMVAKVAATVTASVLVVRRGAVPPRRVVVAVSGSARGLVHVELAARLARAWGAHVTILMVLSQVRLAELGDEDEDGPLTSHLRSAEELLRRTGAAGAVRARHGLVVEEILEEMREGAHDLLILGTHRSGVNDPMYEDLTSELLGRLQASALVVGTVDEPLAGWARVDAPSGGGLS